MKANYARKWTVNAVISTEGRNLYRQEPLCHPEFLRRCQNSPILFAMGFTLLEVLIASIVFMVIFTGLAFTLQSGIIASKSNFGMSECARHAQDGFRLLAEGDNAAVASHPGLFLSNGTVRVNLGPSRFFYQTIFTGNPTRSYDVWIRNGQIFRQRRPTNLPGAPPSINNYPPTAPYNVAIFGPVKVLMGGAREQVSPGSRALLPHVVVATPTAAFPFHNIRDGDGGAVNNSTCTAVLSVRLFYDLDGDSRESGNEAAATFSTCIYFRNSE